MLNADQLASQLTSGSAGWMVASIAAVLPILWAFTLSLHFARPYVIRFLQRMTLRFGGDVWWLSYVLTRDALMMVTMGLSLIFLMPNLYLHDGLPLTAPIATLVLFWALVLKLIRDADDNPVVQQAVSVLLVIASVLYIVPMIYGLEAADQDPLHNSAIGDIPNFLTSNTNLGLARPILWVSLALFVLTGAALFVRYLLRIGLPADGEAPAAEAAAEAAEAPAH